MSKWIVTGGTGLVGSRLVRELTKADHDVVVFSRHPKSDSGRVRSVAWNPEEPGDWMKEVDGADVVVHLTGEPIAGGRWTDERLAKIRSSRTESTALLADAMVSAEKKPRVFLSASAVGIYGMRKDDELLDESTPPAADLIAGICVAWEKAADPAEKAGIRVCHPRFGVVLSPDGGALKTMLPAFRAFVGGPLGDGKQWVSFVHLDDAVSALLFAESHDKLSGPFNITAPNPVTMNELSASIAHTLHRPNLMRVPAVAAHLALGQMADIALTGQRVMPKKLQDLGFEFRYPKIDDALEELLVSG
ncbi:MAG: TIGR01777 family oxidoreductase [Polyangiaceae bacterium]